MGVGRKASPRSLHVGLNQVDPERYQDGRFDPLFSCDMAAKVMAEIADSRGFVPEAIVDPSEATLERVTGWLGAAADGPDKATAGDLVLFTFAGHGDEVPDKDHDEPKDQALVLYDYLLKDDRIYGILKRFEAGVRVIFVVDCCYGGSIVQYVSSVTQADFARWRMLRVRADSGFAFLRPKVAADVLLLSACDEQSRVMGAKRGERLPPFTAQLLKVWQQSRGQFSGGYHGLKAAIGGQATLFQGLLRQPEVANQQPFTL